MGSGPKTEPLGPAALTRVRIRLPLVGQTRVTSMATRLGVTVTGAILRLASPPAAYAVVAMPETNGVRVTY